MRNLKLLDIAHAQSKHLKECRYICFDSSTEKIYVLSNCSLCSLEKCNGEVQVAFVTSLNDEDHGTRQREPVFAEFLIEHQSVFIAFDNGDLVLFNVETQELECVGTVSGGIRATACSPDQDLLVVLTVQDTLILMTKDFDPIVEKNLNPEDFGQNKPITVGWGSKETQFHGSEGKEAAKVKVSPTQEAFPWDDGKVRVSWRGDGKMFVVSSVDSGSRKLRIWNRDGSLLCTSEAVNGLEQSLHWKPSGSVIASTQRTVNKHEVIFFEKNGLRHREFLLKSNPRKYQVKELLWNGDSSVLCIWGCDLPQDSCETGYSVMLWTVSNYHWYQKQTLNFGPEELLCVVWDPVYPFVLHCVTNLNRYLRYRWTWTTNFSRLQNDVAVIDGDKTLVTPLGTLIVPPPFGAYNFHLPSAGNEIVFSSRSSELLIVLADSRLAIFKAEEQETATYDNEVKVEIGAAGGNGFKVQIKPRFYVGTFKLKWENENGLCDMPLCLYHFIWLTSTHLMCATLHDSQCHLVSICLMEDTCSNQIIILAKLGPCIGNHVLGLVSLNGIIVYIQTLDGDILQYNTETEILEPFLKTDRAPLKFPQPCETFDICTVDGKTRFFGLTHRYRLFCDDREVANNCTSFQMQNDFLLLTTFNHTLHCLLRECDLPRILSGDTILAEGESPRALERGSRIVAAISNDTKVVFQMPRGNLETIQPRPLVLFRIRYLLEKLEYGAAFTIMKKHRINLNLLYDDNPKRFEDNVGTFVTQLDSAASHNIFLNELQENDITETMYAGQYRNSDRKKYVRSDGQSKLDAVCKVLRTAFVNIDRYKYFLCILTTYAKMTEPRLDCALVEINELQKSSVGGPSSDEAIRYLMYMVDVNELYDVALSTYNFDIVLMVAEKSQKDPKEYLSFLNDLKKLEPQYQKYKIDMHLHNYERALINISQCGDKYFDELVALVKNHRLYRKALFLFPLKSEHGKILWKIYGDYLMEKKHYSEAGVVYDKCQNYKEALEAHRKSLNWQMVLCSSIHLDYTQTQTAELCKSIAGNLRANRRFTEAANLYEHYVQDIEESIATLLDGQEWTAALSLIFKHKRLDLLETHFKPQLETQCDSLRTAMEQTHGEFMSFCDRLQHVRENKQQKIAFLEENDGCKDADLFSDTSSMTGQSTESSKSEHTGSIATRKTSRRKKQREVKKYSLKEGSAHEDLALIKELSELIKSADDMQETMEHLLKALVMFDYIKDAKGLQEQLDHLLSTMQSSIPHIWPPESDNANSLRYGPSATANSLVAALEKQKQAQQVISDPLLRIPPTIRTHIEWKCLLLEK